MDHVMIMFYTTKDKSFWSAPGNTSVTQHKQQLDFKSFCATPTSPVYITCLNYWV